MTGDSEDGEEACDANDDDDHEVQENSQPAIGHVEQEEGDVVPVQHLTEPNHVRGVTLGVELRNVAAKKWMPFAPSISQNLFREELHKR